MFLFGIEGYNYDRHNLAIVRTSKERDALESQLNLVFEELPSSFKIAENVVFTKISSNKTDHLIGGAAITITSGNKYEVLVDGRKITISDIDDFFFEELPEAQDFVISLT